MLRITEISPDTRQVTLQLEGSVHGVWVEELLHVCRRHLQVGHAVTLDLAGVMFVDGRGLQSLRDLQTAGASVANASQYVMELLAHEDQ